MRLELFELASELSRRGERFAVATVVARKPPLSAQVGDMALVTGDGVFHGWVGGSCTRPTVIAEAFKALEDGRPRLVALDPDPEAPRRPGVSLFPMTCHSGGSVEILIQPVLPAPRLFVYGASPIARALARLGQAMGYAVHAVEEIADGADSRSPPAGNAGTSPASVFAVVATQGEWDEEAAAAALAREPDYLGVVASPKRFAEMRAVLARKAPEARLARIKNPAGLDLGARLPEEIAVSILAEIVKERRTFSESLPRFAEPAPPEEARDPVCGMTVRMQGAAHRARHLGRDYFFCCSGCRERFQATPERYTAEAAKP
jgi:xanthine dehydrogenase accessory factor